MILESMTNDSPTHSIFFAQVENDPPLHVVRTLSLRNVLARLGQVRQNGEDLVLPEIVQEQRGLAVQDGSVRYRRPVVSQARDDPGNGLLALGRQLVVDEVVRVDEPGEADEGLAAAVVGVGRGGSLVAERIAGGRNVELVCSAKQLGARFLVYRLHVHLRLALVELDEVSPQFSPCAVVNGPVPVSHQRFHLSRPNFR